MAKNPFKLKRPVLLWILGCCFIVAPYLNLTATLWVKGTADWYSAARVWNTFLIQDLWAQTLLALNAVAGVSLLIRRKTSWLLAVGLLMCFGLLNIYSLFVSQHWFYHGILPLIVNSSFLIVFRYFRFPYLDRRDQILHGLANRYDVTIPVRVDQERCTIQNISRTGCLLAFPEGKPLPAVETKIQLHLEEMALECTVLRHEKNFCAAQFSVRLPRPMIRQFRKRFAAKSAQNEKTAA